MLAQFRSGGVPLPDLDPLLEARKIVEIALRGFKEPVVSDEAIEEPPSTQEPSSDTDEEVKARPVAAESRKPLARTGSTMRPQSSNPNIVRGSSIARGRENPKMAKPAVKRQLSRPHLNQGARKPVQDLTNIVRK